MILPPTGFLISYSESLAIPLVLFLIFKYGLPRIAPYSIVGLLLRWSLITTTMGGLMANILLGSKITWSLNWNDWVNNFLFTRTTNDFYSAHTFSYLVIPVVYFISLYMTRNEFFSLAYTGFISVMHELSWVLFTPITAYTFGWNYPWLAGTINYLALDLALGYVVLRQFKLKNTFIAACGFIAYNGLWIALVGFAFTVSIIGLQHPIVYVKTMFYWNPLVNAIENFGWILVIPISILILKSQRLTNVPRLYVRAGNQWKRSGWISGPKDTATFGIPQGIPLSRIREDEEIERLIGQGSYRESMRLL
jgi:hypothetical protein